MLWSTLDSHTLEIESLNFFYEDSLCFHYLSKIMG